MNSSAPMTKMDAGGDGRVIPMGSILRSGGLDELAQLINVVRGEMSWVGPRPCLPYEFESYRNEHMGRFTTLPGMTGLWQVCGKNRTTFEQMMAMDSKYARCKTIWLDLTIMMKTPLVLMTQLMDAMRRRNGIRQATKVSTPVAEGDIRVLAREQITVN
jgi:lipopolysaccharide/colanic/teichoic acid biosynthesis glycosyltransferase